MDLWKKTFYGGLAANFGVKYSSFLGVKIWDFRMLGFRLVLVVKL